MNIEQLKAVRTIYQRGSFSKAANDLFVTQPALSMQIRTFEEEIGEPVFKRAGRRKVITSTGKLVLEHANSILNEFESLTNSLKAVKGMDSGEVSIAASDTVTRYLLINAIQIFTKKYPHIRIRISNKTSSEIGMMLRDGKTDIGIITLPFAMKGFEVSEIYTYKYVAITSPNGALNHKKMIKINELSKHHLLLLERGTKTRESLESIFDTSQMAQDQIMELGSVDVQKDMAKIGAGIAIVPDFSIINDKETDRLRVIHIKDLPANKLGIISRNGKIPSAVTVFIKFLKKNSLGRKISQN
ncbi:MAG: LysR family transcriptional regulator [Fibrobacteres bacterium]|nr:LysR family transcriptional regulator [Fibrobacterota bacterium]